MPATAAGEDGAFDRIYKRTILAKHFIGSAPLRAKPWDDMKVLGAERKSKQKQIESENNHKKVSF